MKIKIDDGAFPPERAHPTDAGMDIKSPIQTWIQPHGTVLIRTGVHIQLPSGTAGFLISKSGLNCNYGITTTGLIDEGYAGEICVKMHNHSSTGYMVHKGDKITQLVVGPVLYEPIEIVDEIESGERGESGFGSTGR